jgi:hypothetical protein
MNGLILSRTNTRILRLNRDSVIAWLLIGASIISVSPVFGSLLSFNGNLLSVCFLISTLFFFNRGNGDFFSLGFNEYLIVIAFLIFSQVPSIYWSIQAAPFGIYFLSALVVASKCSESTFRKYADIMTGLHLLLLVGAWIGFIYTLSGGDALFTIKNPDDRDNGFYLTTFSNSYFAGFIRPSGWYDEPGALSFFTCFTVALREVFGMSKSKSKMLLLLGLITGSLAHLIFTLIYFMLSKKSIGTKVSHRQLRIFIGIFSFTMVGAYFSDEVGQLLKLYADRLSMGEDGLAGDSRSNLMINAWGYLNLDSVLWGLDGNCIVRNSMCNQDGFLKYGENPLSMLVHYGIFLSWPYYIFLLVLIFKAIKTRDFIAISVFLLLLQRPNIMSFGYAVVVMAYIYSLSCKKS